MKALLRSSILVLAVFTGYSAFATPMTSKAVTNLPQPNCLPQPGLTQACVLVR
jgi:hypothetical protein